MSEDIHRVTRSKDEAKASYDHISRWYDLIASSEKKFTEIGLQMLDAQPGEQILEIGSGTGQALVDLARAIGSSGKVYGMDISEGMMQVAWERFERAGLAERIDLCLGDAANIPFRVETFNAVFLSFTLELFDTPEIPVVLAECRRALRPGGRLGIVALSKKETLAVRIYEWFHVKMPTAVDCRPIFVSQAVESAGFAVTKRTMSTMWGLPVEVLTAVKL